MTLLGFAGVHTYYICMNQTTIEHISRRPYEIRVDLDRTGHNYEIVTTPHSERLWNLGTCDNWRSVMGNNPWGWFGRLSLTPFCARTVCICLKRFLSTVVRGSWQRIRLSIQWWSVCSRDWACQTPTHDLEPYCLLRYFQSFVILCENKKGFHRLCCPSVACRQYD